MTTRARQTSRQRLDLVITRLNNIAAGGQADPLTPGEAGHYAAIIRTYQADADRATHDRHRVAIARDAATRRLRAAEATIRELEGDIAALRQTTTKEH
ncbi:hypothetical protein ACFZDF_30550 [Streptomyces sp. NPDC007910]|uniref:hypothetical protein n=1 Tax=Streptomyces sp. NPDC007910 TaxID=3364790 RepID=UPI0036E8397E